MQLTLEVLEQMVTEDRDMEKFLSTLQMLVNRMSMSHFKYGNMRDKYPHSATGLESAITRLEMYKETGNTENLLDAANFLLIEFVLPSVRDAFFRPQTSQESPGVTWKN